jgi:hypothetical protein
VARASHPGSGMRAAPLALGWLAAAVATSACSLSLDGDHFRSEPAISGEPDAAPGADFECATAPDPCKPRCEGDDCVIDCRQADTCEASCKEAACDIDCTGASHCDRVKCEAGSECLLDCTGAERCRFEKCDGEQTTCPGDVLACNRDCP